MDRIRLLTFDFRPEMATTANYWQLVVTSSQPTTVVMNDSESTTWLPVSCRVVEVHLSIGALLFAKFFDQVEEKDPYYNFIDLHLTKEHGKAVE